MTPLSLVTVYVDILRWQLWAKTEGVGRDRRQNKTRTPSDFLWILNIETQTASGDKTRGESLKHPDIGTIVLTRGHGDGVRCQDDSGWLSIFNIAVSPLCGAETDLPGPGQPWIISGHSFQEIFYQWTRFFQDNIQSPFNNLARLLIIALCLIVELRQRVGQWWLMNESQVSSSFL